MIVNGCAVPDELVEALQSGRLHRERGVWDLKAERDAFGNPLETDLGKIFESQESMERQTAALPEGFPADDEDYGKSLPDLAGPGAISDIVDFSRIVCFANSGDGAPFCLDVRESSTRPSVIWWDDCYWRRIAPDVESFFSLFDLDAENYGPGLTLDEWDALKANEREQCQQLARERFRLKSNGPGCPQCGMPLRTPKAQQCFACGARWHSELM